MVDPYNRDLWTHRSLFVVFALVTFFFRLLPMGTTAGSWPGPDIILCIILAWVQRRPDYLPALLIAVVVLTEDFLLMRPPGLWTALVLLAAEFLRNRVALTRELSFAVEWVLIAAVMMALLLGYRLIFIIAFLPQPGFGFAMVQVLGSILCYPVVVYLSHLVLGVHKPAMGEVDEMGRRL
ncbi:MAG: rod shape-determining protein MreD [Paracoccaceae bacterium]